MTIQSRFVAAGFEIPDEPTVPVDTFTREFAFYEFETARVPGGVFNLHFGETSRTWKNEFIVQVIMSAILKIVSESVGSLFAKRLFGHLPKFVIRVFNQDLAACVDHLRHAA